MSAEWALVLGLAIGIVVTIGWVLVLPVHRHRWSQWRRLRITDAGDRNYSVDGQIRNCRVCNLEQVRE